MKRLGTFTAALLLTSALTPVYAQQPVTVIGPITVGNCAQFSSNTVIKDAGVVCSGGGGTLGTMSTQNANAVAITGGTITGLPTPSVTADAATKGYVDAVAIGLTIHTQVSWATAAVLPNTPTYNNGSSGVGATLTAGGNAAIAVDGGNPVINDRILVKNQAAGTQNGVYTVTTVGSGSVPWVLTRATDFNTATTGNMAEGAYFFVGEGAVNIASSWVFTTTGAITIGTTALSFSQFAGSGSGLVPISNNNILANISGGSATPVGNTVPSLFDSACSTSAGMNWIRTTVTWVCSKFQPPNLSWWGVKCDNSTDDTAAINAGIAANLGTKILFPPGTCLITASLTRMYKLQDAYIECPGTGITTIQTNKATGDVLSFGSQFYGGVSVQVCQFCNRDLSGSYIDLVGTSQVQIYRNYFQAGADSVTINGSFVVWLNDNIVSSPTASTGRGFVVVGNASELHISHNVMVGSAGASQPLAGIYLEYANGVWVNNTDAFQMGTGLYVVPLNERGG